MDKKLETSEDLIDTGSEEETFKLKDILSIVTNRGWWYIAILCVLFYSAVFPFLKYATDLMVQKFSINEDVAGIIPALLPFGTILLTPFFGNLYDRKGKGATIMVIGALLLIFVHAIFIIPFLNHWVIAIFLIIVLGIGFSLVPSAMWPSVPKIIPEKQLGSAYALIFWVQNWGLMGVPALIGWVLNKYCFLGYFAILGTGFITNQGNQVEKVVTSDQKIFELKEAGSISRKDTTVRVTQFLQDAKGNIDGIIIATGDTILRTQISDKSFLKVQKKSEIKIPLYSFAENGRINYFITNNNERVTKYYNVASFYNYTLPMAIFALFGLIALFFALLLKAEDKRKKYGLELPNIQK